jgi:hypothetical protein
VFQNVSQQGITTYKYFVGHSVLIVQSLLKKEKKRDVYELGVAEG